MDKSMKKILQSLIPVLMKTRGLGEVVEPIIPVSGGFMHHMYKVKTESGTYAVKHLNQEIMKREGTLSNFQRAEEIETILEKEDIPIVAALYLQGRKMQKVDDQYFYIFNWMEGHITDWYHISGEECFRAGNILGRIHAISIDTNFDKEQVNTTDTHYENIAGIEFEHSSINWHEYVIQAKNKGSEITSLLEKMENLLTYAQDEMNKARNRLPDIITLSDEDMDPKNVMWKDGNPVVIDLECLSKGNPVSHVLQLSLQWAGITTCELGIAKMISFFDGYLEAYDNGFRAYEDIFGVAYTWVEWLDYNIQRALGKCVDEAERQMGISEVKNTIQRIEYLHSMENKIKKALSTYLLERNQ